MVLLLVLARTEGGEAVAVAGGVKVTRRGANSSEVSTKRRVASRQEGKVTSHFKGAAQQGDRRRLTRRLAGLARC